MSPRRRAGVALGALALVAVGAGWAVPNLAGSAFVDVRLVAAPVPGKPSASQRHVVLDGGPSALAGAIMLTVRIHGGYPLPVVIRSTDPPLRVELRAQLEDGTSRTVWIVSGSAAELEQGGDSPDGQAAGRAVLIRPGPRDLPIGPAGGIGLQDASGTDLPAGRYVLQAWAFGIPSGGLQLTLLD
jgi:hypothetical protein